MIRVLFFGALREKVGCGRLDLAWRTIALHKTQPHVNTKMTVADVLSALCHQSAVFAQALHDSQLLCAVNQQLSDLQQPVFVGDEVAFFPPVTGG